MAQKTTLRERFAAYNYAECEQGATIEQNWRLVKDEPISDKHKGLEDEQTHVVLVETDKEMSNFAPCEGGRTYKMPDGTSFRCDFKLTPNSTDDDGKSTGFKTYYSGLGRDKHGTECYFHNLDITAIKNRLFGKQAWTSQKGPRVGAIPTTSKEAREFADAWTAELVGHIEEVERILATYGGAKMLPDFSLAKRICKYRARKHSEALYAEYAAEQAREKEQRAVKNTRKQKVSEINTAQDMLKVLAAQGFTLEDLMKAAQAQ